ncbi:putative L-ascorbate peroxidase 6 [Glarea lozoyensis 74030]|uniref:Peroxidase n=1 Tax=Glarea lozoyensis (strain ATCC 74030 / MF5533) TaxID=1104152 RepID=H0EMV1_GLAL7|nr:putative L-ascorbate peroxidase 6 [Glarea lozoyensis 74030]
MGIAGPGLGGLDASIGFESDRPENIGVFVNVTIGQVKFDQFNTVFLSISDLIGVGLADSLATCANDHRRLPLRVGRVDATGPGPAGVPGPADTFAFALAAFNRAGFSQSEMIQAM